MKQWEIQIGRAWNNRAVARAIESVAQSRDLTISLKVELRAFSGCVHWHFKKQRKSGTIEATMWPREKRVWINVQSGRAATWIDKDLPELIDELRRALRREH